MQNLENTSDYEVLKAKNIMAIVCKELNITLDQLNNESRKRKEADIRMLFYSYIKANTALTLKQIGGLFNNKHHSSIIHGIKILTYMLRSNKKFEQKFFKFHEKLRLKGLKYAVYKEEQQKHQLIIPENNTEENLFK